MKLIPLTQGQFAKVDDKDFKRLSKFKWHASKHGGIFYAARGIFKHAKIFMHREILNPKKSLWVHHVDGDGLNNTRVNLRIVTPAQNRQGFNKKKSPRCHSQFRGVTWGGKKWRATVAIGSFDSEAEAARAYDKAVKMLWGKFACPNFLP